MDLLDLLDTAAGRIALWAAGIAGLLFLLRLLVRGLRGGRKAVTTVHRLGDALLGDPDKGIPGMPERMDRIEAELHPNGGGSLRDVVNRLEEGQKAADTKLASMEARLTALETAKPMTINVGTQPTATP